MDDPLEELLAAEIEDDLWFRLLEARLDGKSLVLRLERRLEAGESRGVFEIACTGVQDFRIVNRFIDGVALRRDDVRLWAHNEPWLRLYFRGRTEHVLATIGALHDVHHRLVERRYPLERYLNDCELSLHDLLSGGFGLLPEGPQPLVHAYAGVLREAGFSVDLLPGHAPGYYDRDRGWVPADGPLVLLDLGDSYVACSSCSVAQVDAPGQIPP
jgi:hypothetical protein